MSWLFVIPNVNGFPSGGNVFNHGFIGSLLKLGLRVDVCEIDQWKKIYKPTIHSHVWVDSLYVGHLDEFESVEKPVMLIAHHLVSLYPPEGMSSKDYFEEVEAPKLKAVDGFLTSSEFTKSYLVANSIKKKPIFVCLPGLELPQTETVEPLPHLLAIMVANVIERKGILDFLKELAYQLRIEDRFILNICGSLLMEEDYANSCIDFVRRNLHLHNIVRFTGGISQLEVFQHYQHANIFISASKMETYGIAIQEALGYGLPSLLIKGGNTNNFSKHSKVRLFEDIPQLTSHFLSLVRGKDRAFFQKKIERTKPANWQSNVEAFLKDFYQKEKVLSLKPSKGK